MPFTPSHALASLPFVHTPLLPAALVIGTMSPDLVYFVPLPIHRTFTHAVSGVFTIDLLLGVVLFLLWQLVFRRPLVDFTPLSVRSRVASMPWTALRRADGAWWRTALLLVASLLIGSLTHVLWDSFTHAGAVVDALPWLATDVDDHPVYKWLQWASSLLGFAGIVVWVALWLRRTRPIAPAPTRMTAMKRWVAWISVGVVGLAVSVPIWLLGAAQGLSPLDNHLIFQTVTVGLAAAGAAAVLWSLAWYLMSPLPNTTPPITTPAVTTPPVTTPPVTENG